MASRPFTQLGDDEPPSDEARGLASTRAPLELSASAPDDERVESALSRAAKNLALLFGLVVGVGGLIAAIVGLHSSRRRSPAPAPTAVPSAVPTPWNASACPLLPSTLVAVYTDVAGGVGHGSHNWERNFWAWWREKDARVAYVELAKEDVSRRCELAEYPNLRLYVQPGGNAYKEQVGIAPAGTENIRRFLDARDDTRYVGTCAGWYFASTDYWWQGYHYTSALEPNLLGRFDATIEGSILDIRDYDGEPPYAVTRVVSPDGTVDLDALYYGGPTRGWRNTTLALPEGAETLVTFAELPGGRAECPAAVRYRDMLLFSVHFEAFQDSSGELADGTLSDEQVEANYRYRAARINEHLGTDWATS